MHGIIVIEGADATGKTTLAKYLCEQFNGEYIHLTRVPAEELWEYHMEAVERVIRRAANQVVVLDRTWISEQIYEQVYRSGSTFPWKAYNLDARLRQHLAVYILCVPETVDEVVKHHDQLSKVRKEMYKPDEAFRAVVQAYYDFAHGNPNLTTPRNYVEQITRSGGFLRRKDAIRYRLFEDNMQTKAGQVEVLMDQLTRCA